VLVVVVVVVVLVAAGTVRSTARISASMSSKSSFVCAVAASAFCYVPFLFFGVLRGLMREL
jgi:hypothetical protein